MGRKVVLLHKASNIKHVGVEGAGEWVWDHVRRRAVSSVTERKTELRHGVTEAGDTQTQNGMVADDGGRREVLGVSCNQRENLLCQPSVQQVGVISKHRAPQSVLGKSLSSERVVGGIVAGANLLIHLSGSGGATGRGGRASFPSPAPSVLPSLA